jgi:hypothetical protein
MSESKSKFLIPATVGVGLIVVGGIVAYNYFKGSTGDSSTPLGSAKVVPSTALMAAYISTDSQAWGKLQQFGTPQAQQFLTKGLQDYNQQVLKDSNISYEKDIKPWVGGVMIAVLPANPTKPAQFNPPAGAPNLPAKVQQEPNILLVVNIKDKLSALSFANKLKADKNVKITESDYKGEKIIESKGKGKPTYTTVLNNAQMVLAPDRQTIEQAINTFKGEPSFASQEGASSILSKGVDVKNTIAQIYVPNYADMVQKFVALNPQATPIPPQTLAQLKQVKSMVAAVGIDDAGLRLKAIANLDPQLNKFEYQTTPAKIVSQFPTDTLALVNGQGISRGWQTLVAQSKDNPEFQKAVEQSRSQLKSLNIDLDKEIFGWMNGEFALAAIESNQGILANFGFGGALVFDTSDRKTAESTLTKLDDLAKKQSLTVAQRNIGGKNITEWQIPQQGALFAHGWLDQDTVFIALGGPVAEALADRKGQSLDSSDTFKAVTSSLQQPNGGYFYLDMEKLATLLNRAATTQGQAIPPDTSAILNSIRGFGVTATSPDKSTGQVEMLLALKPSTKK